MSLFSSGQVHSQDLCLLFPFPSEYSAAPPCDHSQRSRLDTGNFNFLFGSLHLAARIITTEPCCPSFRNLYADDGMKCVWGKDESRLSGLSSGKVDWFAVLVLPGILMRANMRRQARSHGEDIVIRNEQLDSPPWAPAHHPACHPALARHPAPVRHPARYRCA